jgi:hypothetical protein
VMVLRALLLRHEGELKLFRRSARRPGFAQEVSRLLNEFQQYQLPPPKLRALAENKNLRAELRDKLRDLTLLHERYSEWLAENKLHDGNRLLEAASEMLRKNPDHAALRFSALWLDGFAEMTPQELDLLAASMPFGERATLAFCPFGILLAKHFSNAAAVLKIYRTAKLKSKCSVAIQKRADLRGALFCATWKCIGRRGQVLHPQN